MIALALHEARMITRRGIWPAALVLHAIVASAFVAMWGPTGGVPLWEASMLQQLTAADQILTAVLLTWLATFTLTDDDDGRRSLADWSAVTGRSRPVVYSARLVLAIFLGLVFIAAAGPAFAAAAATSAATTADTATQIVLSGGFAMLTLGITSLASVALRDRVAVWCTAMAASLIAEIGMQALGGVWLRLVVPSLGGVLLMLLARVIVGSERRRGVR